MLEAVCNRSLVSDTRGHTSKLQLPRIVRESMSKDDRTGQGDIANDAPQSHSDIRQRRVLEPHLPANLAGEPVTLVALLRVLIQVLARHSHLG